MTDALKALAEKVGDGTAVHQDFYVFVTPFDDDSVTLMNNAWCAHEGSLDAAKALHDAVLPGWDWEVGPRRTHVYKPGHKSRGWRGYGDNPARAWLLAILRALITQAEEEETDV